MSIANIHDFKSLLPWLSQELAWDTGIDDFEDIEELSYDFDAKDIYLKPEEFAKITSLKQLRPLIEKQPWGIFIVEFEGKRFEINSLRKILAGLVPKRRNRDHAVWKKENLLFFCFWGEKNNRCFGAFHFEDKENALPLLKAFHVAPKNEDLFVLQNFEERLKKLSWPVLPQKPQADDFKTWLEQWTSAFTQVYRQTIRDSSQLTENLAGIALEIRRKILAIFEVETNDGPIHDLYGKFRKALIHDMTKEQFADMYAQTMVYGLFSARCMSDRFNRTGESEYDTKKFDPRAAIDNIPSTNPFLQNLLKESFSKKNKLSFDELDLSDITLLLEKTNTELIIEDFNRQTGNGREDPVIYFYEGFLNAYEKEQKKRRGVYYTPQPVVQFMVQAVDDILKTVFGVKDGLASTETKTIKIPKKKDGKVIATDTKTVPAIQILDPAVGTGTFLRQIVLQIWDNFKKANARQTKNSIKRMWNMYVKDHLLPRLNGFELMMAPYAVAHMKLALVLWDTEYAFDEDEINSNRVNIFLTNSLEEADREEGQHMMFEHDALAAESEAAKATKKNRGINVVIGNPPYSVSSQNKGLWIKKLLNDYKIGLEEKKLNLDDDYIKFIRYGQHYIQRNGAGVLAYISNNSFIDGITHRQMRKYLLETFNIIYILDLHGNAKKKETTPDGGKDENVFDIQQGVSINIFIKIIDNTEPVTVYHYDLFGNRELKYSFLLENSIPSIKWHKLNLETPYYFFVPKNFENQYEYDNGFYITELFTLYNNAIKTDRDALFIDFDKKNLSKRIQTLLLKKYNDEFIKTYKVFDSSSYRLTAAIEKNKFVPSAIREIQYRPFDYRHIYYRQGITSRPAFNVMRHIRKENFTILTCRQQSTFDFQHVFISKTFSEVCTISSQTKETTYVFPLYLYEGKKRRPNLNPKIISELEQKLELTFTPEYDKKQGNSSSVPAVSSVRDNSFTPINLFDYIYAVLHSPAYRETYREFLKIDFPRIPYPTKKKNFWKLVALGGELRQLHLLEGSGFEKIDAGSVPSEKVFVEKVKYANGNVFANEDFCFDGVSETAWEFYIGGYQPAQKWLKDRKGSVLKAEDIRHYRKIVLALTETARVMGEIDRVWVV